MQKTFTKIVKMMDFLKLETYTIWQVDYFKNHSLLEWVSDTDKINNFDNEVITTKKVKQYKGIYFCFYSNKLEILFKPHYYFNNNLHNANDFRIIDCINVLVEVRNALKIELQEFKVVNIEYGLNVISPIDIKDLITYLAYHEKNEFRTDIGLVYSKKSYSTNANGTGNQYKIIKAYAKGLQFSNYTGINTFRFEVKSKKSRFINQLGIYTANDLLKPIVYLVMLESITNEFEKVLILDCATNFKNLSHKEQTKIAKYNNPMEWYKIKNASNRNSFSKNKNTYYKLTDKVPSNLKNQLRQIIYDKLQLLKKGANSPPNKIYKKGADSQLYNRGICTQKKLNKDEIKKPICKVTGINIEMQKNDSFLLSHTGLKYYYKTDRNIFEQIKRRYLSKKWLTADSETQIKEIAHNIRNAKNNQNIKQDRIYPIEQVNMFSYFDL
jgi:hypothetical protein